MSDATTEHSRGYSEEELQRIAGAVADRFLSKKDSSLDTCVENILSTYKDSMSDQHVRRVCEYTYHAVYRRLHDRPGSDSKSRYVEFTPPDTTGIIRRLGVSVIPSVSPNTKPTAPSSREAMSTTQQKRASDILAQAPRRTWRPGDDPGVKSAAAHEKSAHDAVVQEHFARSAEAERLRLNPAPTHQQVVLAHKAASDEIRQAYFRAELAVSAALRPMFKMAAEICDAGASSVDVVRMAAVGAQDRYGAVSASSHVMLSELASVLNDAYPFTKQASIDRPLARSHPFYDLVQKAANALQVQDQLHSASEIAEKQHKLASDALRMLPVRTPPPSPVFPRTAEKVAADPAPSAPMLSINNVPIAGAHMLVGAATGLRTRDRNADLRTAQERGSATFRAALAGTATGAVTSLASAPISNLVRRVGGTGGNMRNMMVDGAASAVPFLVSSLASMAAAHGAHATVGRNGVPVAAIIPAVTGQTIDTGNLKAASAPADLPRVYRIPDAYSEAMGVDAAHDGWRAYDHQELQSLKQAGVALEEAPPEIERMYWQQALGMGKAAGMPAVGSMLSNAKAAVTGIQKNIPQQVGAAGAALGATMTGSSMLPQVGAVRTKTYNSILHPPVNP